MQTDIAIIGGGMTGATLACLVAQTSPQLHITLIDSLPFPSANSPIYQPSFDDRVTALANSSAELLQQLGVWQQIAEQATPITTIHVSDRGHLGGAQMSNSELGVDALGYVVANAWLGRCLFHRLEEFPHIRTLAPADVVGLQPKRSGASLAINQGGEVSTLTARVVVVADGRDSELTRQLGIHREVDDYQQTAIVANVAFSEPHQGRAFERFTSVGPVAVLPMGGADGCQGALVWSRAHDDANRLLAMEEAPFLDELQAAFGYRIGKFTRCGRRESYPLLLTQAKEQIRRGIVVMGNAAHTLHPVAGQGFNLSLRDCSQLAACLAGLTPETDSWPLLQHYQARRQVDQNVTISISDQLIRWFTSAELSRAAARSGGLLTMELLPPVKELFTRQTMGVLNGRPSMMPTLHRRGIRRGAV